jgi:flagellar FliL protein
MVVPGEIMAEETKEAPAENPAPKGGSKLVLILLGVNMLLVVGVLTLFLLKGGLGGGSKGEAGGSAKGEAHEAKGDGGHGEGGAEAAGASSKMADFVIHLRDAEVDRYARVTFEVELAGEADKTRFDRYTARVRDGFISYLSDRTLEELRGSEQVRKQKLALQEQLKDLAPGVKVRALYITDLVIQ